MRFSIKSSSECVSLLLMAHHTVCNTMQDHCIPFVQNISLCHLCMNVISHTQTYQPRPAIQMMVCLHITLGISCVFSSDCSFTYKCKTFATDSKFSVCPANMLFWSMGNTNCGIKTDKLLVIEFLSSEGTLKIFIEIPL